MASARDAVCGIERLVTRSLAIVAIAVAAGAAHSWFYGPLNPDQNATTPPATNTGSNTNPIANPVTNPVASSEGDSQTPDSTPDLTPDPTSVASTPQGNENIGDPGTAADPETADPETVDPTNITPAAIAQTLPEGHITTAQAYDYYINSSADFIDARPADEYALGHVPGALNLSLAMTKDAARVQDVLQWLDTSRPIIVYCRGGLCSEAKDVGRLLSDANYSQILIFADGFPGWQDAGYMIETGPGQ